MPMEIKISLAFRSFAYW